jgi:glucan 1,3-beta-glucosidase
MVELTTLLYSGISLQRSLVFQSTRLSRLIFSQYSGCKIIFFDAGVYIVSDTITIPAGTQMVGEAWTVLAGKGSNFQDQKNPRIVFKVGDQGSRGVTEITDIVFTTIGRGMSDQHTSSS